MGNDKVILEAKNLNKVFGSGKKSVHAVVDANLSFREGEVVSIVGESGSGKTTFLKMLLGLLPATSGEICFRGRPLNMKKMKEKREYWKEVQAIFQDPFSTFNQFFRVEKLLDDCIKLKGWKLTKEESMQKMIDACKFVNLEFQELYNKLPFELSGGQMQRLMIARIFMINPSILIADEATSMIDACSRSTILDMLMNLRKEFNTTIIFVTHDIGLAYYISDNIYIMQKGVMIERGSAEQVVSHPQEPYTKQLLTDVPKLHEAWDI